MNYVSSSLDLRGKLPSRSQVGKLDPEIAGEGQKIILSEGDQVSWMPPPPRPLIPDWSQIKQLAKYFNKTGHQTYPAWLYHPTEEPRIVKNADEAHQLGVFYRQATIEEKGRYGLQHVWDWEEGCLWRPQPYEVKKFDPRNLGHGKVYIPAVNPATERNQLLEALIPAVAAAVAQSIGTNGPGKPAKIADSEWDEFLKFKAWQQAQSAVDAVVEEIQEPQGDLVEEAAPSNALNDDQELVLWRAEAERKGVKIDKRWGLTRIKAEIEKAA